VENGVKTLENAYNSSEKTPADGAYLSEKQGKAKAKIAQWKAEQDYWRGEMEKANAK